MKNNPYMLRALYIILVPMVLLIILLNSGWLQRFIPAASVNGENYSVVRYNYYYYDYQTTFLHAHEHELDELGYNPDIKAEKQDYDGTLSWKEFFQRGAEAQMAETAYYCAMAEQNGYLFSEEELAPVAQRVEQNAAAAANNGISIKNYYIAYYGPGMDEERYTAELTQVVKAQTYKRHLIDTYLAEQSALEAYLAEHEETEYASVQLQIIVLNATPDRATGEIGKPQLDALQSKLEALIARYDSGASFEELQRSFSDGEEDSILLTRASEMPEQLKAHYIEQQSLSGGTIAEEFSFLDEGSGTAYFAIRTGEGESGRVVDANAVLGTQAVEGQQQAHQTEWLPEYNGFGMLLAAS